jgi:hypothetical protein
MVLVGEPAMVEAVRTTQSTFGIWAIVAVAMICLAAWLISVYVADGQQTRLSRMRRRMDAQAPVLSEAEEPAAASIPGQRRDAGQPEPETASASEAVPAQGRHARPADYYAAADFYAVADYKAAEKRPAGNAATSGRESGGAEASGAEAGGAEAGGAEAGGQADAPTRPDLPAQAAPTGRHAMPSQRSGDSDRAERARAGTDDDRQDDQDQR